MDDVKKDLKEAEQFYLDYVCNYPDSKLPYISSSQVLSFYHNDLVLPHLKDFDSRLDSYYEGQKNLEDPSKGKMFCFAPASRFSAIVEEKISKTLDLSGIDLFSDVVIHREGEEEVFPPVRSVVDYRFFTISEVIDTMKSLILNPSLAYDKLCKTYIQQKRSLIELLRRQAKIEKMNKSLLEKKKCALVEIDYSGLEEKKCSGDQIPYLSKAVESTMHINGEVLSALDKFDERLECFHTHNWVYAVRKELYMMKPATFQVENMKEKIKKSVVLRLKNFKLANDKWTSVNDVIDFRYFTVEEVIDYMEQLV